MESPAVVEAVDEERCRVIGRECAGNGPHRAVLSRLERAFDEARVTILCEPSLSRNTARPPDLVVIDPASGVHVVEVKGVWLDQVESIGPGGALFIRYATGVQEANVIAQVRKAMFDIKNATEEAYPEELTLPFRYWVVFPSFTRAEWHGKWGRDGYTPPEFLFGDDLSAMGDRLRAKGAASLASQGLDRCPEDQLKCVMRAFGDSSVLYQPRLHRQVASATLGELFDTAALAYKNLSEEQQTISADDWPSGPRLVRGVAGSGKTIVLANNCARRIERATRPALFEELKTPRILVVCYNRCLVPHIKQKIESAYRQRTGNDLPADLVEVNYLNGVMWDKAKKKLWRYHKVEDAPDEKRAALYLQELEHVREHQTDLYNLHLYDAIYADEGQDFHENDFKLLKALCRHDTKDEPSLFIFYDDAQNLFGRQRPNWKSVGLKILGGRSHVMTQCHRNTRQIVESSFNVLYGRFANSKVGVPLRDFGDLYTMTEKGLITEAGDHFKVGFCGREGRPPSVLVADDWNAERRSIVERLRWLVVDQQVRPEDILVLAYTWKRVYGLASSIRSAGIPGVIGLHLPRKEAANEALKPSGNITLSTVASAKGYDAYCTLVAAANDFPADVCGRASFYVGCTRALEYLELFAHDRLGLVDEFSSALGKLNTPSICSSACSSGSLQLN